MPIRLTRTVDNAIIVFREGIERYHSQVGKSGASDEYLSVHELYRCVCVFMCISIHV